MVDASRNSNVDAQPNLADTTRTRSRHLWTSLASAHRDLNDTARREPGRKLSDVQKKMLSALFRRVHEVLKENPVTPSCLLISEQDEITAGDALLMVGQHRAALRTYRITVLGEDEFALS
jgi:hypothetical protein